MEHHLSGVEAKAMKVHAAKVWESGMDPLTTQTGTAGHETALLKAVGIHAPPGSPEAMKAAKLLRHDTEGKALEYRDPVSGQHIVRHREPGHGGNFDMMVIDKVASGHSLPEATKIATIVAKMKAARSG